MSDLEKHSPSHKVELESDSDSNSYVEVLPSTWKGYIWDSYDKPKEERWFLFKLDLTLLFIGSAGVFLRYLDQTNVNNAFVSGMKEELSLYGNQLNYANTAWSVGYIIGQIPSNILLPRVRPHYWIAFLEITWSVLTFCTSTVQSASGLYAIRFFVGLAEAGHFPA